MTATSTATSSHTRDENASFSTSASSSSSDCNSPSLDTGLNLDPSDPLNLLLKSAGHDNNSAASPPDWSELSSLWTHQVPEPASQTSESQSHDIKSSFGGDFMDFGQGMSIDPSTLQFDPNTPLVPGHDGLYFDYPGFALQQDLFSGGQFPFTFHTSSDDSSASLNVPQRRLSVSSSSSSSGASFSPVVEHNSPPVSSAQAHKAERSSQQTTAEELAELVRQSAGVLLAVPMGPHIGGHGITLSMPMPQPTSDLSDASPPPHASSPSPSSSSAASTPPPTTPPSSHDHEAYRSQGPIPMIPPFNAQSGQTAAPAIGANGRPKTSHTTIERRYRTNLNARILSLRMAVPALRVLERNKGAKGAKKITVDITSGVQDKDKDDGEEPDIVDERGFVDGVRVARKCSKANVLGKAVEYIRVLKKRESRLRREKEGLRSLLSGLVGGPALLREWEREWTAKFGGPETDELTESEILVRVSSSSNATMANGGSDAEDDDDDEGDGDDDGSDDEGRKRKKPKVSTAKGGKAAAAKKEPRKMPEVKIQPLAPIPGSTPPFMSAGVSPAMVPEKRKRGRPRKNPLPVPTIPAGLQPSPPAPAAATPSHNGFAPVQYAAHGPDMMVVDSQQPPQSHTQQYLLATFALFSFFNSPLTSSSFSNPPPSHSPGAHTHTGHILNPLPAVTTTHTSDWTLQTVLQVFHLLVSVVVFVSIIIPWLPPKGLPALRSRIATLFGVSSASSSTKSDGCKPISLAEALAPSQRGASDEESCLRAAIASGSPSRIGLGLCLRASKTGFEHKGLAQRAWVRLGEITVLSGSSQIPLFTRLQTYLHMRAHLPWLSASAADLSTLALLVHDVPLIGRSTAAKLWERAREKAGISSRSGAPMHRTIASGLISGPRAREYEKLVLGTLTASEAVNRLKLTVTTLKERCTYTPLGALASLLVKERVRRHLQVLFINAVSPTVPDEDGSVELLDNETAQRDREDRRRTVDAARSLGGRLAELGDVLERVCITHVDESDPTVAQDAVGLAMETDSVDAEIKTLLDALLLYRKIFPSSIVVHPAPESGGVVARPGNGHSGRGVSILLSPPSNDNSVEDEEKLVYRLRRALGSTVFESAGEHESEVESESDEEPTPSVVQPSSGPFGGLAWALEDARDRVVDMLVDCERAGMRRRYAL